MSKTKKELALDILALEGRTTVREMKESPGWSQNCWDARKIAGRTKRKDLVDMLRMAKKQFKLNYSSVWFVARMRVRVPVGIHPNSAIVRMNKCLGSAVSKEYGEQFKGAGVELVEDPVKILKPVDDTYVPVIHGAVKFKA